MKTQSFIDNVITEMATGDKRNNVLANLVQAQDHDNVVNRIALTYVKLANDRAHAKRANLEVTVKPEHLFGFVRQVMDQVVWAARRLWVSQQTAEAADDANGLDFSQAIGEETGVECVGTDHIGEVVGADHALLDALQVRYLQKYMNYLDDVEPLYLFADRGPDTLAEPDESGNVPWITFATADTFDEALQVIDKLISERQETEAAAAGTDAAAMDFSVAA